MSMILIRFPDDAAKRKALGLLLGRFSFKSWATGEVAVPDVALAAMAVEGISFAVSHDHSECSSRLLDEINPKA